MDWKKDRHITFARNVQRGIHQRLDGWKGDQEAEIAFNYVEDEEDIDMSTLSLSITIGDRVFDTKVIEDNLGGENSALAEHVAEEVAAMWVHAEHVGDENE